MKKFALFFKLTAHEQRGFLVVLFVIVLLQMGPLFHRAFFQSNGSALEDLVSFDEAKPQGSSDRYAENLADYHPELRHPKSHVLKPFDPNGLPEEQWRLMGFSDKQIRVIKNYEKKGGRFYRASDVKKIYAISESDFQRISPFLRFADESPRNDPRSSTKQWVDAARSASETPVDMNEADTIAWKRLPGIGSVLSKRIVKFRDRLGGFHKIDQLREVYGISEETMARIRSLLLVTNDGVQKLSVNRLSEAELSAHPYISARDARHIVRYREQHGSFQDMADLKKNYALDPDFLLKIEPYLQFN
ncbi:helix-hairpin-helix domain-containing protein [Sphingobacterium griseoflavum]|uniref:Competence protein ComEA n=1 Tax=Sphingobacterium griseoflavum TaxID=1474952 RepID=A0ABQ3HUJ5_9SPHI|nr:helix-hairpin-helix domain-containing protein [Sphingobacterium griseoflavum]GHE23142.1 competence protein ComEA [Sphingobacterium griseoflavum]